MGSGKRVRMDSGGAVQLRWLLTLLLICLGALGAGLLVGFWLGS